MREDFALCMELIDLRGYARAKELVDAETSERPAPDWAGRLVAPIQDIVNREALARRTHEAEERALERAREEQE